MPTATAKKTFTIRESCAQDKLSVDEAGAVLRDVVVLGGDSKNRRRYTQEAMEAALPLYEGQMVNLDHPTANPNQPRSVRDRFGKLGGCRIDGGRIRADLKYNPKHGEAPSIAWFAENMPECVGLSHNSIGEGHDEAGVFVVDRIVRVRSVDLVADPATTKGLFEASMEPDVTATAGGDEPEGGHEAAIGELVLAILKDEALSTKEKRTKVLKALKLLDDGKADAEEDDDEPGKTDKEPPEKKDADESVRLLHESTDPAIKALVAELDALKAEKALASKQATARRLCEAAKLPSVLVTDVFLEQLVSARDEKAMKVLVEDRRRIAGVKQPRSDAPPATVPGKDGKKLSAAEFAAALRNGTL